MRQMILKSKYILVGFILLAVYLPMFDVMQHVGK